MGRREERKKYEKLKTRKRKIRNIYRWGTRKKKERKKNRKVMNERESK